MLCNCIACRHVSNRGLTRYLANKRVRCAFFIKCGVLFFGVVKFIRKAQLTYLKTGMGILR